MQSKKLDPTHLTFEISAKIKYGWGSLFLLFLNVIFLPVLSRDLLSGAGGFSLTAPALAALSRLQNNDIKTFTQQDR